MGLQSQATLKISRVVSFRFDLPAVVALGMIWRASTLLADVTSLQCGEPRVVTEPGLRAFGNRTSTIPARKTQTFLLSVDAQSTGADLLGRRSATNLTNGHEERAILGFVLIREIRGFLPAAACPQSA